MTHDTVPTNPRWQSLATDPRWRPFPGGQLRILDPQGHTTPSQIVRLLRQWGLRALWRRGYRYTYPTKARPSYVVPIHKGPVAAHSEEPGGIREIHTAARRGRVGLRIREACG